MLHQSIDNSHRIVVPHVIKGETIIEAEVEHHSRATGDVVMTPAIDLNTLIWPRSEPGPAFQPPISDIVDILDEVGKALDRSEERGVGKSVSVRGTLGGRSVLQKKKVKKEPRIVE